MTREPISVTIADVSQFSKTLRSHLVKNRCLAKPFEHAEPHRAGGCISQWKEQLDDPQLKIGRPRQLYMGETARDYVPIDKR